MRRRRSVSFSSGTCTLKGRISVVVPTLLPMTTSLERTVHPRVADGHHPSRTNRSREPLAEALESVQEEVQGELELELVVAALAYDRFFVVGPSRGHLRNMGVPACEFVEHRRPHIRFD